MEKSKSCIALALLFVLVVSMEAGFAQAQAGYGGSKSTTTNPTYTNNSTSSGTPTAPHKNTSTTPTPTAPYNNTNTTPTAPYNNTSTTPNPTAPHNNTSTTPTPTAPYNNTTTPTPTAPHNNTTPTPTPTAPHNNTSTTPSNSTSSGTTKKKKPPTSDVSMTHYTVLKELTPYGQEQAFCEARGACLNKTLICPAECPVRKPKKNKKNKACRVDCGSRCEVTCRWRRPNCNGYGSLCYDPRFIGGDGVMFYFHGAKGGDFAIFSDDNLHINGHFIGSRPQGRTRDYTWVQALSVMFDAHTLVLAAKRVSHWDDAVDALTVSWNGHEIDIPADGDAEWATTAATAGGGDGAEIELVVERTDDTNSVRVKVAGLLEMDVKVRPIGEEENRVHNYQLPAGDAFAHLETQFKFLKLSDDVEGVLGKTYRPGYVSPVKKGVRMPMMGGEDKYQTTSLYSTVCKACRFERPSGFAAI